jgi:hypothetical protein
VTLSELIDLEAQLGRDSGADPGALQARDRGLLPAANVSDATASRSDLLRRWLAALRSAEPGRLHPGATVAAALRALRAAVVLAGLLLGWGAATALLRYTGQEPVNVWDFLLVFVGLQILLFVLLLCSFFLPVAALGTPLLGLFRGLVAALYPRLAARGLLGNDGPRLAEWRALWHRLRSRRSLYHAVEPWLLLGITQAFGVAFNLGALAGCLRLIVFSDIAFSWSTTLVQLDAHRFHALLHALSAPFGWLWGDAAPSAALVEATRYSRLEGSYLLSGGGRAAHPELVGGWWPFLMSALIAYGLLPRLGALIASQVRAAGLLQRLPLDDAEVSRVLRRLAEPRVETRSLTADPASPSSAAKAIATNLSAAGTRCALVLWRDVPRTPALEAAVARHARCPIEAVHTAGGSDYEEGSEAWARRLDGASGIVVLAEGWEAPDKAALRLLRDLRRRLGPRGPILVLLAQVSAGGTRPSLATDVRIWEQTLAALEDPYLAVEALREPP